MKNTTVANAQDGIKITHENLSRFNKRLHKAMKDEGLDVSYTFAANLLAKSFGKRNTHELLETLKLSDSLPKVEATQIDNYSNRTEDLTTTYFDYEGAPIEVLTKVFFSGFNIKVENFYGRIRFIKDVGSLPGCFKFKIEQMQAGNRIIEYVEFENFKIKSFTSLKFIHNLKKMFEGETQETKERLERDLMFIWRVKPGEYYEVFKSANFNGVLELNGWGDFEQSFMVLSKEDFTKEIASQKEDLYLFQGTAFKVNGRTSLFVNNIDLKKVKIYESLEDAVSNLVNQGMSVVIPVLKSVNKADKNLYSFMIITMSGKKSYNHMNIDDFKVSVIHDRILTNFNLTICSDNIIEGLMEFTKGYTFKDKMSITVNNSKSVTDYNAGANFLE